MLNRFTFNLTKSVLRSSISLPTSQGVITNFITTPSTKVDWYQSSSTLSFVPQTKFYSTSTETKKVDTTTTVAKKKLTPLQKEKFKEKKEALQQKKVAQRQKKKLQEEKKHNLQKAKKETLKAKREKEILSKLEKRVDAQFNKLVKPIRAPGTYGIYLKENYVSGGDAREVIKQIAQKWKNLSVQEKQKYSEKQKALSLEAQKENQRKLTPPKRFLSPYVIYCTEHLKKKDLTVSEAAKKWATMSEQQKTVYIEKGNQDKIRFEKENKIYLDKVELIKNDIRKSLTK